MVDLLVNDGIDNQQGIIVNQDGNHLRYDDLGELILKSVGFFCPRDKRVTISKIYIKQLLGFQRSFRYQHIHIPFLMCQCCF